jgi:hypothetical protein
MVVRAMRRIRLVSCLLWLSALALSILFMVKTLNDLAALLAMRLGVERLLMGLAPMAAKYIAAALRYIFRIPVTVYGPSIYLEMGDVPLEVYLDWNYLGWQGFLLMLFALLVGVGRRNGDGW